VYITDSGTSSATAT